MYFFWRNIFRSILILTLGCLDNVKIFFDSRKFIISVVYMREHIDFMYILYNRIGKNIIYYFWQIIFRAVLLLTLGAKITYRIFFDSHKFRISVFYMREHIGLVYILQNRIEKGIVYFLKKIVFREILLLTFGYLDNI